MARLFLGLGSNLGERESLLNEAIVNIGQYIGKVEATSAYYETEAWGFQSSHTFLNACVLVQTSLSVRACLEQTQAIERSLGRSHKTENGLYQDRCIDIDILFYDDEIVDEIDLKVPHPLMHQRKFVLEPLAEIAPDFIHPQLHQSCKNLLISLT